jgi:hypothetical protein
MTARTQRLQQRLHVLPLLLLRLPWPLRALLLLLHLLRQGRLARMLKLMMQLKQRSV